MKPSEMGLHSRMRYAVKLHSGKREEQMQEIIALSVDLFDVLRALLCPQEEVLSQKFARFVSLTLAFEGFSDKEVFRLLNQEGKRRRRILG